MHDIFFFTDIHGMYNLYNAIMVYCYKQDPECTIIFGGDACDRGPWGYQIMKELLDNKQVIYLKGNHEDMFVRATRQIKSSFDFKGAARETIESTLSSLVLNDDDGKYYDIINSIYNGGLSTLVDWITDGMPMSIVERIENLPLTFSTDTCDFCHSAGVYRTFKRVADSEYDGYDLDGYYTEALIWGRSSLGYGWAPNRIAVFGHTPVPYLKDYVHITWDEKKIQPVKYRGEKDKMLFDPTMTGSKIDMDTGAVFTARAYVLNVLTMKAQGFKVENNEAKKIEVIQF